MAHFKTALHALNDVFSIFVGDLSPVAIIARASEKMPEQDRRDLLAKVGQF